jgi:hypothetical protein
MSHSLIRKLPLVAFLAFVMFSLVVPFFASAQTVPDTQDNPLPKIWNPSDLGDQLLVCTGNTSGSVYVRPCQDLCDLVYQIVWIVCIAITWVIWVIAPISFIAGGIMYMLAGANPGTESKAKDVLKGAVIGVAIVLCSFIIINTVVSFFGIAKIGGFSPGTAACSVQ